MADPTPAIVRAGDEWWRIHAHVGTMAQREDWEVQENRNSALKILRAGLDREEISETLALRYHEMKKTNAQVWTFEDMADAVLDLILGDHRNKEETQ